ncbi:MAG: hypothetical protein ABMA13_12365 [Chthoniobacteraceae bacterium]
MSEPFTITITEAEIHRGASTLLRLGRALLAACRELRQFPDQASPCAGAVPRELGLSPAEALAPFYSPVNIQARVRETLPFSDAGRKLHALIPGISEHYALENTDSAHTVLVELADKCDKILAGAEVIITPESVQIVKIAS